LATAPPLSAIDTSVLIEFIDESGDFHPQATAVIESIISGRLNGVIAHPVLAELYYVSYRIFEKLSARDESPGSRAGALVDWLFKSPNIFVPANSSELAIEAGKIKQKFKLALPDSYVISLAKLNKCEAVFKSAEEEMTRGNKLTSLKKDEKVNLVFLEDYT
jgi:uncharacterized protein